MMNTTPPALAVGVLALGLIASLTQPGCALPSKLSAEATIAQTSEHRNEAMITPAPSSIFSPTISPAATGDDACFLYRWRGLTMAQIKAQGINWKESVQSSFGSVSFSIVLLGIGIVLMAFGWWLGPALFFLLGFVGGSVGTFYTIDLIFDAAHWSNCLLLGIGSLLGGLCLGLALLRLLRLGIFCLGAALGVVLGYEIYVFIFFPLRDKLSIGTFAGYDGIFWICLIVPALVGGLVALYAEKDFNIATTSLCGAFAFMVAFDQLFLTKVASGHFDVSKMNLKHLSADDAKYFYILCAATILLALLAMCTQRLLSSRHQRNNATASARGSLVAVEPERRYFAV